jgi:hypothetical protein
VVRTRIESVVPGEWLLERPREFNDREFLNVQVDDRARRLFTGNTGVFEACVNKSVISRYTVIVRIRSNECRLERIATYKSKIMLSPTLAVSDEGENLMLSFAPTSTVKVLVAGLAVDDG